MRIKVKVLEANDALGRYRFATPQAEAVGQFDHADSYEEIEEKVRAAVQIEIVDWEEEADG